VVEGSGAGAEGLLYRVQAVQNIHAFSVIGWTDLSVNRDGRRRLGLDLAAKEEAGGAAVGA
jgi:hypothetical protein